MSDAPITDAPEPAEATDPLWDPKAAAFGAVFIALIIVVFEVVPRLIAKRLDSN